MLSTRRRRGFTLIELLIVIIIMGILAGSMMLAMGKARAKAEATKIVSNLRTLQKAAMMYCADNGGEWIPEENFNNEGKVKGFAEQDTGAFLAPYLDGELAAKCTDKWSSGEAPYAVLVWKGKYYAIANVDNDYVDYATRKALEEMVTSPPFYNGNGVGNKFKAEEEPPDSYKKGGNGQLTLLITSEEFPQ